jgi:hypothetical protein
MTTSGEARRAPLARALAALPLLLVASFPAAAHAHAVLRPGDVVVVGIATSDGVGPGRIYVAFLAPLHVDGELRFTDDGRRTDGTFRRSEGNSILEAVRMPIERGTVISIDVGTMSMGARDQVGIYEGRIDAGGVLSGGAIVFQASWGGPFTSDATSDTTGTLDPSVGPASIALSASAEAYEYIGRTSGTRAQILAEIHDAAFWRTTTRAALSPPGAFAVTPVRGEPCAASTECPGGFSCVDDVCCETSCGGGVAGDCITCDFGATPATGTCGLAPPEHLCRSASGYCDLPEQCDGVSGTCPADLLVPSGFVCRPVRDLCDVAEYCDGADRACPLDAFAGPERRCRDAVDGCDIAEYCGGALSCPADMLGCFDAGPPLPDAGAGDAGTGASDVGLLDAGPVEVGLLDVGLRDVGLRDVGRADTSAALDVGDGVDPGPGCSCRAGRSRVPTWTGLLTLLALLARRR